MKKTMFLFVFITGFIMLFSMETCMAQQGTYAKGITLIITMQDGSQVSGKFISQDNVKIVIESLGMGIVSIEKSKIKTVKEASGVNVKKGKVWFANPNPYKYLIGSSAIPKRQKTATYQNVWIFFNSFSYAPLNFMDISAGFEIFSLLSKSKDAPYFFYLNPKVSTKVLPNLYIGGNILYLNFFNHAYVSDFQGLGTMNAFATYGNSNMNITAGIGWGFVNSNFSKKPLITISGMARVSRRIAFITENWFLPNLDNNPFYGVYSYGIRFLGEKNSIDLAFINSKDISKGIAIGIPFLDFVVNF